MFMRTIVASPSEVEQAQIQSPLPYSSKGASKNFLSPDCPNPSVARIKKLLYKANSEEVQKKIVSKSNLFEITELEDEVSMSMAHGTDGERVRQGRNFISNEVKGINKMEELASKSLTGEGLLDK